jgi:hypothetical protein
MDQENAVQVIDIQYDFGSPGGMFDRARIDLSVNRQAAQPTQRVIAAAQTARVTLRSCACRWRTVQTCLMSGVATRRFGFGSGSPLDGLSFALNTGRWPHCVAVKVTKPLYKC